MLSSLVQNFQDTIFTILHHYSLVSLVSILQVQRSPTETQASADPLSDPG